MGLENVHYDAFISYRHSPLDKATAIAVQKKLENFKLPKSLIGKTPSGKDKIERVFRDQDELPLASNLSDPIEDALKNSDNLIVICTPRLPESAWCAKEIETFISLHGREHVFAVLAEGEPEDSFPDALRFERRVVIEGDGTEHEVVKEFEPLAADTRGSNAKETKKMTDDAVLRLAAPIFGLNYDDLKQRHKEQRTRKIIAFSSIIASVFFVFAMVCMFLAVRISSQKDTIEQQYTDIENQKNEIEKQNKEITKQNTEISKQNEEISKQNDEITRQNTEILAANEEITRQNEEINEQYRREQLKYAESMADAALTMLYSGLRKDAIYALVNAMPSTKEGIEAPYSGQAEYALANCLGAYRRNKVYQSLDSYQLETDILLMSISPDYKYFVTLDNDYTIHIYDTDSLSNKEIQSFNFDTGSCADNFICFLDNDSFIMADCSSTYRYSISKNELKEISDYPCLYAAVPEIQKYVLLDIDNLEIRSCVDDAVIKKIKLNKKLPQETSFDYLAYSNISPDGKILTLTVSLAYSNQNALLLVDLETDKFVEYLTIDNTSANGIVVDNTLFISTCINSTTNSYTTLYAYSLESKEVIWTQVLNQCRLQNISCDKKSGKKILFHSNNHYCVVDTSTLGSALVVGEFPSSIVSYCYATDDYISFLTVNSDVYIYSFTNNILTNFTATFFEETSSKIITNAINTAGSLFVKYNDEDYIAHFVLTTNTNYNEYYSFDDTATQVSPDGKHTILISKINGKNNITITDTHTNESIVCEVDSNGTVFFIKDGSEYWGIRNGGLSNQINVYDYTGNLVQTIFSPEENYLLYQISPDGKYAIYIKPHYPTNDYILIFTETGEIAATISSDIVGSSNIYISDFSDCYAVVSDTSLSLYHFNSDQPYAVKEIKASSVQSYTFSSDGRYLLLYTSNNSTDVLDTNTLETKTVLYNAFNVIKSVTYVPSIDSYLLVGSTFTYLLNSNFEIIGKMIGICSFDNDTEQLVIEESTSLYYYPYVSYEKMYQSATAYLADYIPSDRIKAKYHIE